MNQSKLIAPIDSAFHLVNPKEKSLVGDSQKVMGGVFQALMQSDWETLKSFYDVNYVQHSPYMVDGAQGVIDLFAPLDFAVAVYEVKLQIAEGPYIINLAKFQAVPQAPQMAVVDIHFIKDGRSLEHWDVGTVCDFSKKSSSGYTFFDSPFENIEVTGEEQELNKLRIADFINQFFNQKDYETAVKEFVDKSVVVHSLNEINGIQTLKDKVSEGFFDSYQYKIMRIVSENDLLLAHSRIVVNGKKYAGVDFFRMREGKIVEYWNMTQEIPPVSSFKHNNGMF